MIENKIELIFQLVLLRRRVLVRETAAIVMKTAVRIVQRRVLDGEHL